MFTWSNGCVWDVVAPNVQIQMEKERDFSGKPQDGGKYAKILLEIEFNFLMDEFITLNIIKRWSVVSNG